MKQILFPTAYTDHAQVAYRYAQKLAQYFNAGITLVHIYQRPLPMVSSEFDDSYEDHQKELLKLADQQWEEELAKLKIFASAMNAKQFQDIPLDYIVTDGNVVQELTSILQKQNYDLLIMGMRRHNRINRLFGSTTYTLIEKVECPLLLIPPGVQFLHIDKIVYGTAFEFGNKKAIDLLLNWCLGFKASLHMLHLYKEQNKLEAAEKMNKLKADYEPENKQGIMTFQMLDGKIKDLMDWYVAFNGAVLLAIHWRKQGLLQELLSGNSTKELVEKTEGPLLVLK